ncbi:MAG: leucine-rich repeat domain-containing protein, partial [Muribaculaceae bacterium]|nr:leucine-rich repeat domain-containing protein [Muribaculaceae bacterium]
MTIKGKLGADDLKVLRSASGKLATVNTLDLSETELVEDESTCYASLYGGATSSNNYLYDDYYISNRTRTETGTGQTDLGVGVITTRHYVNDFSAVFNGTQAYRKIIMPALSSIGEELISGNKVVEEIVIPEGARFVGTGAFAQASSLKNVILPMSVDSVGTHAFRETTCPITLQSRLRHIGYGAFRKSAITEIDLSEVKTLGEAAFDGSSLAGELDLTGIATIPDYAFNETSVTKAMLSPEITAIGAYAFASTPLADINLPENGLEVGSKAFDRTPWFTNNVVADAYGIKYIGNTAYEAVASAVPSEVTIADGTTVLGARLFGGCSVTKVNLPQTVRVIGESAFESCKLTEITWPESLEEIRDNAFKYCSSLWFDSFPDKLRHIGRAAFLGCTGLTEITFPEKLEIVDYYAFNDCSSVSLIRLNSTNASMKLYLDNLTRLIVGPKVELIDQLRSPKLRMVQFAPRNAETPLAIGDNAFGSTLLEECLLPDNTVSLGSTLFFHARKVNIGRFPSKVKHVGAYAFQGVETPC